MCGINGIAISSKSRRSITVELLERMRDAIVHRGPDDQGIFVDDRVGLGHRRLSIVDVSAGHQPMTNEDGSLHITYNGEIYNHTDYRGLLERAGHVYRTHCDTETILHLYEEYGSACVDHLRGMFAFAIWDQRKKELFIARDRLGVKPLYYAHTSDGSLFFASEIKALLVASAVQPELNLKVLPDYLANHSPSGEDTFFKGVKRLLPGHTLFWRDGSVEINRYWDVSFAKSVNGKHSTTDYVTQWSELFRDSVRLRLMADVPLGMFLSGGIDSSAIAAVMSKMVDVPIKTFSVGFIEDEANELGYARLVANTFKTDHHEVIITPREFFAFLPKLVWHEDEPIAHPASVPLYFVSRLASEKVKVVLTGEGSDELLAGYGRYRKTVYNLVVGSRYQQATPTFIRTAIRSAIASMPSPSRAKQKLLRTFLYLSPDIETIYFDNFAVFQRDMQQQLLTPQILEQVDPLEIYEPMQRLLEQSDAQSALDRLLYIDIKTYLQELLMKQDQMSMAASIESRVPFLDHKLVEFTAGLPEQLKLNGFTTKYILRESMKNILPEQILRRRKMGFPVPLASWFRNEYRAVIDEYVLGERSFRRGLFNESYVRALVSQHQSGERDHTERLWALLNFEIWSRLFLDCESADAVLPEWNRSGDRFDSQLPALMNV